METPAIGEGQASGATAIVKRPKPEFITIGEGRARRQLCSTGRFSLELAAKFVIEYPRDRWISVGELARTMYGANTITNKMKVRDRLSRLGNVLLKRSRHVLLYEYDGPRISQVKVFAGGLEVDRQSAMRCVEKMAQRSQWTQDKLELLKSAILATEQFRLE